MFQETDRRNSAASGRGQIWVLLSLVLRQAAIICWVFAVWLIGEAAGLTRSFLLPEGAYGSMVSWVVAGAILMGASRRVEMWSEMRRVPVQIPALRIPGLRRWW
jgi:hypothetical protein